MEACKNCIYHRYIGIGILRNKTYIAFPYNRPLEYKDEKCIKHGCLTPECQDFKDWESESIKKKKKNSLGYVRKKIG